MKATMKNGSRIGLIGLSLSLLLTLLSGCNNEPARRLPDNFQVKERVVFKLKNSFDVEADGVNYGKVSEHLVQLTRSFDFADNTGSTVATASVAIYSWGTEIKIVDSDGKTIGTIKEEVLNSLFSHWNTYEVLDAQGKVIAHSKKSEFFATTITLENKEGQAVAEVRRGMINLAGDSWSVSIKDRSIVDARILPFIAAYKTVSDNEKKAKESGDDKKPSKK